MPVSSIDARRAAHLSAVRLLLEVKALACGGRRGRKFFRRSTRCLRAWLRASSYQMLFDEDFGMGALARRRGAQANADRGLARFPARAPLAFDVIQTRRTAMPNRPG